VSLEARGLCLGYGGASVVEDLDLVVPEGKRTALIGPNGCGKSTLLRGLSRLLRPEAGDVLLDGRSIFRLAPKRVARRIGVLPQGPVAPEGMTVRALVAQGRYAHHGFVQRWTEADERAVGHAVATTGLESLLDRPVDTLSGGQRQRAWIAMVLAQETEFLLLDEPTTFLDVAHQVEVLDLLAELNEERDRTVVMVLHDINQACRYAHELLVMKEGGLVARGEPGEIVTVELVEEVFGLPCRILPDPVTGTPLCVPLSDQVRGGSSTRLGGGSEGDARSGVGRPWSAG